MRRKIANASAAAASIVFHDSLPPLLPSLNGSNHLASLPFSLSFISTLSTFSLVLSKSVVSSVEILLKESELQIPSEVSPGLI